MVVGRSNEITFKNLELVLLKYRISESQARGRRLAYAEAAGLVLTEAIYRKSFKFFIGAIISSLKIFLAIKD